MTDALLTQKGPGSAKCLVIPFRFKVKCLSKLLKLSCVSRSFEMREIAGRFHFPMGVEPQYRTLQG